MTPDMAAIRMATIRVCTATPPGSRPASTRMPLKRSFAIPDRSSSAAIRMNIGIATSEYSVMKPKMREVTSGSALPPNQPKVKSSATSPVTQASGRPVRSRRKMQATRT